MTTIVTRAGKGSALTWVEGDANFTNLNTDKIENILEDLTPQLGGDLDVNDFGIYSIGTNGINMWVDDPSASLSLSTSSSNLSLGQIAQIATFDGDINLTLINSQTNTGRINLGGYIWPLIVEYGVGPAGTITSIDDINQTLFLSNVSGLNPGQSIKFFGTDIPSIGLTPNFAYTIVMINGNEVMIQSYMPFTLVNIGSITNATYTTTTIVSQPQNNQVLTTDASGNLTWTTPSTTATILQEYVMNQTGVTIPKGSVVYISGANGTNPLITLSQANTEMGSSKTLGFTTTALTQGSTGYVITNGLLEGVNTDTATIGDPVWLSSTTAGGMVFGTANRPIAPNHTVYLGVVVRVNQNNGAIVVKVQNGYELYELHNVSNATPNNNDVLTYISSTGLWTPAAGGSGGGITDIVNDLSPQLGADLDVNGKSITSVSNGNIMISPNGSGNIMITPGTGQIILGSTNWPTSMPSSGQVLTAGSGGVLSWATPSSGGGGGTSGLETNFLLMGA